MSTITRGLYQSLVTEALKGAMEKLDGKLHARYGDLHHSEVADRIAMHISHVVECAIDTIEEGRRVSDGIALARELISRMVEDTSADLLTEQPSVPGQFLTAILAVQPDGQPEDLSEPLIPLVDTALLTNAPGEPRVGHQIVAEIPSADRIDFVMAFIRRSGIRPMLEALRRHCDAGRKLRVLTTIYTGTTEADALEDLKNIGAEIRVSYDTSSTRLHAKAWLFHRQSGFSTAYIGSSNLTHSAQVSGLEWNVRFSAIRNEPVVDKVAAVFESYWHSDDFVPFDLEQYSEQVRRQRGAPTTVYLSPTELRPEPFQERLLEQIALSRYRGFHRNLLVSPQAQAKRL